MPVEADPIQTRDRRVWDRCAHVYERQVVCGHPDVAAYESFEEDLLDRILLHLVRDQEATVSLLDVGCGSGRLHLRYGKEILRGTAATLETPRGDPSLPRSVDARAKARDLAEGIARIDGIDFSSAMLDLARAKLIAEGLGPLLGSVLRFQKGSAFDLEPLPAEPLPVVVTVCNSIGVMQGPAGAVRLFEALRRAVEPAGGIAVVSGYRKDAIPTHALGNYESTMDVSGQPKWLVPDEYAAAGHVLVPRRYKRAYDPDPTILVDVRNAEGAIEAAGVCLKRDPEAVREVCSSGHIQTHGDYESHWYSVEQFQDWIGQNWPQRAGFHLEGRRIDALRAAPAQLAFLDPAGRLDHLLRRWK